MLYVSQITKKQNKVPVDLVQCVWPVLNMLINFLALMSEKYKHELQGQSVERAAVKAKKLPRDRRTLTLLINEQLFVFNLWLRNQTSMKHPLILTAHPLLKESVQNLPSFDLHIYFEKCFHLAVWSHCDHTSWHGIIWIKKRHTLINCHK